MKSTHYRHGVHENPPPTTKPPTSRARSRHFKPTPSRDKIFKIVEDGVDRTDRYRDATIDIDISGQLVTIELTSNK